MQGCTKVTTKLVYFFFTDRLTQEEKLELKQHCRRCAVCETRYLKVGALLEKVEKVSEKEELFALRLAVNPVFETYISDALYTGKEETKEELRKELLALKQQIINELNSYNNEEKTKTPKEENLTVPKTTPLSWRITKSKIKVGVTVFSLCMFLAFNLFIIFKYFNLHLNKQLINNESSYQRQINLYEKLDNYIDEYLTTKDFQYLAQAQEAAQKIQINYQDNYGVDLVNFYKKIDTSKYQKLLVKRKELKDIWLAPSGDNYQEAIVKSSKLKDSFLELGDNIDAYRCQVLLVRFYAMRLDVTYKPFIEDGLTYSLQNKYLYLKLYFSLWDAKVRSDNPDDQVEKDLIEIITTSSLLSVDEIKVSASMTLAGIYLITNENRKALALAQDALTLADITYTNAVSLLQVSGLACFKLKDYEKAEEYFQQSIKLSQKYHNNYELCLSHCFTGILLAEKGNFKKAEDHFTQVETFIILIKDPVSKMDLTSRVTGYRAKSLYLQGEYIEAVRLYKNTLEIMKKLKVENNLEISQLNEGIALALEQTGDARASEYKAIAAQQKKEAESKKQVTICLFSFSPVTCD